MRLLILFLLLIPFTASASENPVWVEVTGAARQGDIDTQKEVKERAKRDAQTNAVEKAVGVFLKAHTLVSNNQVADDLIYASVRGVVDKIEILHEGWDEKDRNLYRVSMKALVKPIYPERGEGLSLKASLSKTDLKEGEEVKIFYQTSADAFIYLFSVAADGSVTLLLPNKSYQDNFIHSGKAYEFPPEACPIHLQAQFLPDFKKPVAEEKVKIIATKQKEEIISLGFREGMFKAYDARSTGMISELVRRLNQLDPAAWTETTLVYRIVR